METILLTNAIKPNRVRWKGRSYLVVPISLIAPGVLNGSHGRVYYPPSELADNPQRWDDTPIVIQHPYVHGVPVTAKRVDVLHNSEVGRIYNTRFVDKLYSQAWLDEEVLKRVSPEVYANVLNGVPQEISTGLGTKRTPVDPGSNHDYDFVATNYVPDHVAILPGKRGACSVQDGCGLSVNSITEVLKMTKQEKIDWLTTNCECWKGAEDKQLLATFNEPKLDELVEGTKAGQSRVLVANAAQQGFTDIQGNFHSFNPTTNAWESKMKEVPVAAPVASPVVPATPSTPAPSATLPTPTPGTTVPAKTVTFNELLAAADPATRESLQEMVDVHAQHKSALIDRITNAQGNTFTKEKLKDMSMADLRGIASLITAKQPSNAVYPGFAPVTVNGKFDETDFPPMSTINWNE